MKRPRRGKGRIAPLPPPQPSVRVDAIQAGSRQGVPCYLAWTEKADLAGRVVDRTARNERSGTGANVPRFEAQRYIGERPATPWVWGEWCFGKGFAPGPYFPTIAEAERFLNDERTKHGQP